MQWPRSVKSRSGWVTLLWVAIIAIGEAALEWAEVLELPGWLAGIVPPAAGAVRFWLYHQRTKYLQP